MILGTLVGVTVALSILTLRMLLKIGRYGYLARKYPEYTSLHTRALKIFGLLVLFLLVVVEMSAKTILSDYNGSEVIWSIHQPSVVIFCLLGILSVWFNGKSSKYHALFAWPTLIIGFVVMVTGFAYFITHLTYVPMQSFLEPALVSGILGLLIGWILLVD